MSLIPHGCGYNNMYGIFQIWSIYPANYQVSYLKKKCLGTIQRVFTKYLQTDRNVGDPDYCITNYNGIGGILAYSLAFALHLLVSGTGFCAFFLFF